MWGLGLGVGFRVAYRHVPLEILMNSLLCILTGVGCGVQDCGVWDAGFRCRYGVATISRLLKIIGRFCRLSSLL